jgi:hypothetical protein
MAHFEQRLTEGMMHKKAEIESLVAQILDGTELQLHVDSYTLEENLEAGEVRVHCLVHDQRTGEKKTIEGCGVGIVDAFFAGMVMLYAEQFPSLNTIRFADFALKADVNSGRGARADMAAEVSLRIANSEGKEYVFKHASPSITRSTLAVVLQGVEFFINSERAFIAVYRALNHARTQNRPDSVERYTAQLAILVEATSYTEVIEQIRTAELKRPSRKT